ncbi:MarR family winged helix-turn-helix transcriptional regulator [Ornithinibacillus salinisoli]|uniref:MarR family winged helix-turn-helix transcriptional regulator n=1 Tax=Ornithinibacillus salinisoli TaxID=1848459 RepID=A0ABW4W1Y4_9BACI
MDFIYKQNTVLMVRALYFCMETNWSELGRIHNLSPAQQHILFILSTNGNTLTPSEISEIGCWHISTVTRLLKPLKQRGFITVIQDPKRSKFKKVTITSSGNELFQQIVATIVEQDSFPFEMSHLSKEELDSFLHTGRKILDANKGEMFGEKLFNAKIDGVDYTNINLDEKPL